MDHSIIDHRSDLIPLNDIPNHLSETIQIARTGLAYNSGRRCLVQCLTCRTHWSDKLKWWWGNLAECDRRWVKCFLVPLWQLVKNQLWITLETLWCFEPFIDIFQSTRSWKISIRIGCFLSISQRSLSSLWFKIGDTPVIPSFWPFWWLKCSYDIICIDGWMNRLNRSLDRSIDDGMGCSS